MRYLIPLLVCAIAFANDGLPPLRVFLRCGPKTHGPGAHDHPAFMRNWQTLLTAARMQVSVGDADAMGVQSFPSIEELTRTDVIVIHRQGGGDFKPDERERITQFAQRGGSFVVIHAGAVAGGDESADFYKNLVGGTWRNKITKWREGPMRLNFVSDKTHLITAGVTDFDLKDEIYYDMDLRSDIQVLATAPTPKKSGDRFEEQPQIWAYEKAGAQRAFVFIPGHMYANFRRPDVKLLLLRGIAWAGRRDVHGTDLWARLEICPPPPSPGQILGK